ncbi:MAG TPA: S8 family serine peptidase [Streptosporangiaceae bacterium]|nr:S8 family serine peptidase [Streptosporangiaceae bacterium]
MAFVRTGAVLVAALLLAATPGLAAGAGDVGSLPTVPQTSSSGTCTKPSTKTVNNIPWPQVRLDPQRVWQFTQGAGVTVAVVDSGVDSSGGSPLAGQVGNSSKGDCTGHGTFVSGLIAARPRPGVGFSGLAPAVHLLAQQVTAADGTATAAAIAKGIQTSVDDGAGVVVVTATVATPSSVLADAVKYAARRNAVVVAPATDDAGNALAYPAQYSGVLSAAAVGPDGSTARLQVAPRIDLVAPGLSVMSVGPGGSGAFTGSGASFAAAYVGAAAALVRSYRPDLTAAQVVFRLESTAYAPAGSLPDRSLGFGNLDVFGAVTQLPAGPVARVRQHAPQVPNHLAVAQSSHAPGESLAVAGAALLLIAVAGAAALVVPRGRARGWRAP